MSARLTADDQLALPRALLASFPGVDCFRVTEEDGRIVLSPLRLSRADEVRKKLEELGVTEGRCEGRRGVGTTPRLIRPRVVLDTNVLVSALLFRAGSLKWLVDAWQTERVHPLASRATVAELLRVLGCPKFRLAGGDRQALVEACLPWREAVVVSAATEVQIAETPKIASSWNWRRQPMQTPRSPAMETSWRWPRRSRRPS